MVAPSREDHAVPIDLTDKIVALRPDDVEALPPARSGAGLPINANVW